MTLVTTALLFYSTKIEAVDDTAKSSLSTKQDINAYTHLDRSANNTLYVFNVGDSLSQRNEKEQELKRRAELKESPGFLTGEWEVIGESREQCVIYAKRVTGIDRVIGYAGRTEVDGSEPKVSSIGIMKEWGHAVVVESINGDEITVTESNWAKGKIIRRKLSVNDMRGYVYR